jgi:hypothetical protein
MSILSRQCHISQFYGMVQIGVQSFSFGNGPKAEAFGLHATLFKLESKALALGMAPKAEAFGLHATFWSPKL